jgi:hypothetical protein
MDIDKIIDELKAEGWWLDNHFYRNNRDFLKAFAKKLESKQSSITAVSHQRELLKGFKNHLKSNGYDTPANIGLIIEDYLKTL